MANPTLDTVMTAYETRTIGMAVSVAGEAIFHEGTTKIEIADEAAGEFLEISQEVGVIKISPEEWPTLRAAIDKMIGECRNA